MPRSRSCSMRHRARVVLPEPEPPSTAAWRFRTFLLRVTAREAPVSSRPARMLGCRPPFSSRITESGSSSSSGTASALLLACAAPTVRRFVVGTVAVGAVRLAPHAAFAIGGVRRRWLWHAIAEQVEAQQLGERRKLGQQLGLREPSEESPGPGDDGLRTRAPSSCAPTRVSARGTGDRRRRGTCGMPAPSGSCGWAGSRTRAA